ncbi:MAG: hypothetical protein AABX37_04730, partial [Nanoarchaeota archaeon]
AQDSLNEWSWQKARGYYFQALTGATNTERGKNYGKTFRALGQVMHLIADLAVPEHTRNDTHVIAKTVEGWALNNSNELNTTATAVSNSIFQNSLIQGLTPITNLWDTYQYAGYNPSGPIGLAEYSNYNFLSHDTVFKDYEYPGRTNTFLGEPSKYTAEDGTNDNLIYYSGTTSDGISIPHLAFTTYLFSYISQLTQDEFSHLNATLDDRCFKNYADILIPKAISYSAGLLNYFFRGNFKITNASYDSTSVSMWIRNKTYINTSDPANSAIEPMGTGSLWVSYSYKDNQGNTVYGLSNPINVNNIPSVKDNAYLSVTFSLNTPIPSDASDVSFILIFKGVLGNESDAIAAKKLGYIGSTRIAYYHQPGGFGSGKNNSYIYSIDPDGQNIAQLTNDSDGYEGDFSPALSPDGTKLAFSAQKYGTEIRDIIVVSLTSPYA